MFDLRRSAWRRRFLARGVLLLPTPDHKRKGRSGASRSRGHSPSGRRGPTSRPRLVTRESLLPSSSFPLTTQATYPRPPGPPGWPSFCACVRGGLNCQGAKDAKEEEREIGESCNWRLTNRRRGVIIAGARQRRRALPHPTGSSNDAATRSRCPTVAWFPLRLTALLRGTETDLLPPAIPRSGRWPRPARPPSAG